MHYLKNLKKTIKFAYSSLSIELKPDQSQTVGTELNVENRSVTRMWLIVSSTQGSWLDRKLDWTAIDDSYSQDKKFPHDKGGAEQWKQLFIQSPKASWKSKIRQKFSLASLDLTAQSRAVRFVAAVCFGFHRKLIKAIELDHE